jgi:CHRD domain-containing protein
MKRLVMVAVAVLATAGAAFAFSDEGGRRFREFLNGYKEAPAPISTTGTGTFKATISKDELEIEFELTFENLEDDVLQAHIHIGHPQNSGGIVLWLCQTAGAMSPVASTPQCDQGDPGNFRSGTVTGTLTAADVRTQTGNGIAGPAEWAEVLGLIRAGRTYANVHSKKFPGGEIRSQLDNGEDNSDDHGHRHH